MTSHTASADFKALDHVKRACEAMIFVAPQPISLADMAERMEDGAVLLPALLSLQQDYAGRGVELVQRDGGWCFRTASDLAPYLTHHRVEERKISRAALETLAIISYHQPVTRAELETIRGVMTSKGTLDTLLEAGWIKPGRRRELPGRPLTWVTTPAFLDHFALSSLNELPGLAEMKAAGLLDRRAARDVIPHENDLFATQAGNATNNIDLTPDVMENVA
ncbi:MAG: SMC-Scp complex subunit ScpB [Pseudomonadota bacterium]